jgi:amino acid transporter
MGLDGLASSAYGPEAALAILAPLGILGSRSIWIMAPVLFLLAVLYASYFQTLRAYPTSGGAYAVAKENLGREASLTAATALMIDYVLNVAVAISAGVGALTSAVPALHAHTLGIGLGILCVLTLVNLRGTRAASRLWAVPTYVFVASFLALIALGIVRSIAAGGAPRPVVAPPALPRAAEAVSAWLLLRAFASGCTAMTGVEAVSNGIDAFREPVVREARRTLTAIVAILGKRSRTPTLRARSHPCRAARRCLAVRRGRQRGTRLCAGRARRAGRLRLGASSSRSGTAAARPRGRRARSSTAPHCPSTDRTRCGH